MNTITVPLLFGILASLCAAEAIEAQDSGTGPNPAAPPETAQWAFFIGEWDCFTRSPQTDGTVRTGKARWVAQWTLDGWAIRDDWYGLDADGTVTFHGMNIRSFNPRLKKWEVRWLPQGTLEWKQFSGERNGDRIVKVSEFVLNGRPALDRTTWSQITDDSFLWTKDISFDNGATWREGVLVVEARRVK